MKYHLKITLFFAALWLVASAAPAQQAVAENIIIQTDREIYVAGEELYFKAFIFGETTDKEALSNVGNIVLRDSRGVYNRLFFKTASNGEGYGSITLPDTLKTGYYEIVGFTSYMRNFGGKSFFRKQIVIVNRFDEWLKNLFSQEDSREESVPSIQTGAVPVKIITDRDSCGRREKIRCRIETVPENSMLKPFSISVKEVNACLNSHTANEIVKDSYSAKYKNLPERDGLYLTGTLLNKSEEPVKNECLFLSTPDTAANLIYTFTDHNGRFSFFLNHSNSGKKVIIKPARRNPDYLVVPDDRYELNLPFEKPDFKLTRELRKYIMESQKLVTIRKAYGISNKKQLTDSGPIPGLSRVYSKPGSVVFPSEFVPLHDFKEISENILPGTRIKSEAGSTQLYMLNKMNNYFFQQPATVFLDGVYIYDLKPLMNLNSAAIARAELCHLKRVKGNIEFHGILSIFTANKNTDFNFDTGSCIMDIPGYHKLTAYSPPNYNFLPADDPVPDIRQLLYWNQDAENSFEFFTSDWAAEYVIEVSCINKQGEIVKVHKFIKVE